MRFSRLFSEYLFGWIRFMKIKNDPELAAKSKRFGKMSIVLSVFSVIISVAVIMLGLTKGNIQAVTSVVAIILAIVNLVPLTGSLAQMVYQFRLNKLPVRWAALVFLCIAAIGCILAFVVVLTATVK